MDWWGAGMTEDASPMVRVDPERSRAFVRGLIPRAMLEAVVLVAGVAGFLMTEQVYWIVAAAILGSAPVAPYVLKYARETRQAQALGHAARATRSIVE